MRLALARSLVLPLIVTMIITVSGYFPAVLAQESGPERIARGLYRIPGACNVYVIKRGERAILIDSGEGRVLELAAQMGIKTFDWVLHTHSHRDQCAATPALAAGGTRVAVPRGEARFFEDVSSFWREFDPFIRYRFKPDNFKPRENIVVHRQLSEGQFFEWEDVRLEVLETPGHTVGGASFLMHLDGVDYAFTGDMIHSPGKVWNLFHFDHHYWDGGFKGITQTLENLEKVLARGVQVLLPSHGDPLKSPRRAVDLLRQNLEQLYHFGPDPDENPGGGGGSQPQTRWRKVTEHLYHYRPTSYILLSRDGSALFYDYYAVPGRADGKFSYDSLSEVVEALGITTIDVAIPSHFHEDHVRGFPSLKEKYGTRFWVYENMADILAHSERYNLCCLAPETITADRVLHDGEKVRWKEYDLSIMHFPGQTMYHQAMATEVDGRRVLFMGDTDCYATDDPQLKKRNLRLHGISTFLNFYLLEPGRGYEKAMQRVIDWNPELLLFAHGGAREGTPERYRKNLETIRQRIERVAAVLPHPDPNLGFDPNWASFYPYTAKVRPGERLEIEVRLRNHLPGPSSVSLELRLPAGWSAEPASTCVRVSGKGNATTRFAIAVPAGEATGSRKVVTARVIADGQDWGEFCEMLVDLVTLP